jgi:tRNA dimethylallyltransferase
MWKTRLAGSSIPLIVVIGPTAVGKTALAVELAQALDGEIVSADSRQLYRFMDIGTAKPTSAERGRAPHHLLDVVNPDETLTLAAYLMLANSAITEIYQRGNLPLLVGGTGQYVTALLEGWNVPRVPPNADLRADLEAFAAEQGSQALHDRLRAADPTAAETIDYRNVRRVIRALEVIDATGQTFSEQQRKTPPPYDVRYYGLTMDRERLYARADTRVDTMMREGFLDEVRALLARGYDRHLPSMSGLGYAQLVAHLLDSIPLETAIANARIATHDFIRRQYTWFRGHDSGILWHNSESLNVPALVAETRRWLEGLS